MEFKDKTLNWSNGQYVVALAKLKAIANSNIKPSGYDDTTFGDKSTECNHGLCSKDLKPTTAISRAEHHICPLDMRETPSLWGCFYYCAYFNSNKYKQDIKQLIKDFVIKD